MNFNQHRLLKWADTLQKYHLKAVFLVVLIGGVSGFILALETQRLIMWWVMGFAVMLFTVLCMVLFRWDGGGTPLKSWPSPLAVAALVFAPMVNEIGLHSFSLYTTIVGLVLLIFALPSALRWIADPAQRPWSPPQEV